MEERAKREVEKIPDQSENAASTRHRRTTQRTNVERKESKKEGQDNAKRERPKSIPT